MNTKLTLSLDKEVIIKAKSFAKSNDVSLSFLIENLLLKIVSEYKTEATKKTSLVDELSGIISLPRDFDYKKEYSDYLLEKYK